MKCSACLLQPVSALGTCPAQPVPAVVNSKQQVMVSSSQGTLTAAGALAVQQDSAGTPCTMMVKGQSTARQSTRKKFQIRRFGWSLEKGFKVFLAEFSLGLILEADYLSSCRKDTCLYVKKPQPLLKSRWKCFFKFLTSHLLGSAFQHGLQSNQTDLKPKTSNIHIWFYCFRVQNELRAETRGGNIDLLVLMLYCVDFTSVNWLLYLNSENQLVCMLSRFRIEKIWGQEILNPKSTNMWKSKTQKPSKHKLVITVKSWTTICMQEA